LNALLGGTLLAIFATILISAGWFLIVTSGAPLPETPPDFLDLHKQARLSAWGFAVFAAAGWLAAVAILLKHKWGWLSLAILLSLTMFVLAAIRLWLSNQRLQASAAGQRKVRQTKTKRHNSKIGHAGEARRARMAGRPIRCMTQGRRDRAVGVHEGSVAPVERSASTSSLSSTDFSTAYQAPASAPQSAVRVLVPTMPQTPRPCCSERKAPR
jgi:hypothetical protein